MTSSRPFFDVAILIASCFLFALYRWWHGSKIPKGLSLPPGPKPSSIPWIGNAFNMPTSQEWLTITKWRETYGPLVMVRLMGRYIIFVNTAEAAARLLSNNSSTFSDRPRLVMVNELMGWDFNMGLQRFGPEYQKSRTIFNFGLSKSNSATYRPVVTREITLVITRLENDPANFEKNIRDGIAAIVMMITYGYQTVANDDFVQIAEEAQTAMVSAARPGAYLVDYFPPLKYVPSWFPGADFKRVAQHGWRLAQDLQNKPFAWAMEQYVNGNVKPSFFKLLKDKGDQDEKSIKSNCAVTFATAADTILSSILTFILGMLHSPEAQKKGQEEIDTIIGQDRLPTFDDKPNLPYISAIVKEALRWELVSPLGVPHRITSDQIFDKYFLPDGSTIVFNQWAMSHDSVAFDDPMKFNPDRFLDGSKELDAWKESFAFGWARRICPGRHLAEDVLWLQVACILSRFYIRPSIGSDGKKIIPSRDYISGLSSRPESFMCDIVRRSATST